MVRSGNVEAPYLVPDSDRKGFSLLLNLVVMCAIFFYPMLVFCRNWLRGTLSSRITVNFLLRCLRLTSKFFHDFVKRMAKDFFIWDFDAIFIISVLIGYSLMRFCWMFVSKYFVFLRDFKISASSTKRDDILNVFALFLFCSSLRFYKLFCLSDFFSLFLHYFFRTELLNWVVPGWKRSSIFVASFFVFGTVSVVIWSNLQWNRFKFSFSDIVGLNVGIDRFWRHLSETVCHSAFENFQLHAWKGRLRNLAVRFRSRICAGGRMPYPIVVNVPMRCCQWNGEVCSRWIGVSLKECEFSKIDDGVFISVEALRWICCVC